MVSHREADDAQKSDRCAAQEDMREVDAAHEQLPIFPVDNG
jgi:hypothetical protein